MSKPQYERHELSRAFFDLSPEEFIEFSTSIGTVGVKEPIVLFEGKVLDGWQRYSTATGLGVPCPFEEFDGTLEEAIEFVEWKHNRRNLNAAQRIMAALNVDAFRVAHAAPGAASKTNKAIAQETETSERSVEQARAVLRKGIPAVKQAVEDGDMSLKRAEKIVSLPKSEQKKAMRAPAPAPAPAQKWSAPPGRVPKIEVGASKQEADELRLAITTLSEENDRLNARLAAHFMEGTDDEKAAAAEMIANLQQQAKTLAAELSAVKGSRNHYMEEANELKKQCAIYRNQLQKHTRT